VTEAARVLQRLVASNQRLSQLERDAEQARVERDALLRTARDAGVGWDAITEATGLARSTVAKALRRQ
jgi:hypothetical protein